MQAVKAKLWKKLHSANEIMQTGATNLAQLISTGAMKLKQFATSLPTEDAFV